MLTKILDYEFNLNGLPIDRSGQGNHGQATATVFTIDTTDGTKAAGFLSKNSRIIVPHNTSWNEITATRIDVRVRLDSLDHRANLVEIERSVALFIRKDGVVTFTFLAPEEDESPSGPQLDPPIFTARPAPGGSVDPFDTLTATPPSDEPELDFTWQGVNTDAQFAPNGQRRTVPLNQYVTISAVHDGIATMRIFIDGELAGARYDVKYSVLPLVAPGVVSIGAWPHDERYTLHGSLDFVRIWRHDPRFNYHQFFCRPMSAETKCCWHKILRHITGAFDDKDRAVMMQDLIACVLKLQRTLYRVIAGHGEESLLQLQRHFRQYMNIWCNKGISGPDMRDFMKVFLEWLRSETGEAFDQYFTGLFECLTKAKQLGLCDMDLDLKACDPAWAGFIDLIGQEMPNPFCIPRQPDRPKQQCDPSGSHGGH